MKEPNPSGAGRGAAPEVLRLRGHHLLCLQGFQGYGYSPDFVANLAGIVARLAAEPRTAVELVAGNDAICARCPHAGAAGCQKDRDAAAAIRAMDAAVLAKLGRPAGHRENAKSLWERVNRALRSRADAQAICGDCRWREQCLWYQRLAAE